MTRRPIVIASMLFAIIWCAWAGDVPQLSGIVVDTSEFEQKDMRWVAGVDISHTIFSQWFGRKVENTFGLQVRNDWIRNGLYQSENRVRVDKTDSSTGNTLPATTQADRLIDMQAGLYAEDRIQWAAKFRSVAALRSDVQHFD